MTRSLSKIITIIVILLTQVLKQQNYKLEASNANLSMMSSTMSPLQVIIQMMTTEMVVLTMNITNLSVNQLREVRVNGAGALGIQAHLCW